MKKLIIGLALLVIDFILAIVGITCLAISNCMDEIFILSENLFFWGIFGVGLAVGSFLTFISLFLIVASFESW